MLHNELGSWPVPGHHRPVNSRMKGNYMPVELMRNYYKKTSNRSYVNMTMALHCAPFLKGIKDSALLVLKPEDAKVLARMLRQMNAKCKTMYRSGNKIILLLYREQALCELLKKKEIQDFLETYGYESLENANERQQLDHILGYLRKRFQNAYGKRKEFPHEIGVFLGYPMEDVVGFIENEGQNYLLTGYWKVYSNKERALELFHSYDEARESAIYEVLEGKKFYEIAV